jgi:hypothetical protein
LICNGDAINLVDKDLLQYANCMDDWEMNLLTEIKAGTPARKLIREIPEEESAENAAAD